MNTNAPAPLYLASIYWASSLAGGLALLMPFVALALVLAYGLGHLHGALRLFLGYVTLMILASALSQAIRLGYTLRVGSLKVNGANVQRLSAPRKFWSWVALHGFFVSCYIAGAACGAWVTLSGPPPM
jgi:hypothetical protein